MKFLLLFLLSLPAFAESVQSVRINGSDINFLQRNGSSIKSKESDSVVSKDVAINPSNIVLSGTTPTVYFLKTGRIVHVSGAIPINDMPTAGLIGTLDYPFPDSLLPANDGNPYGVAQIGNGTTKAATVGRIFPSATANHFLIRFDRTEDSLGSTTITFTGAYDLNN